MRDAFVSTTHLLNTTVVNNYIQKLKDDAKLITDNFDWAQKNIDGLTSNQLLTGAVSASIDKAQTEIRNVLTNFGTGINNIITYIQDELLTTNQDLDKALNDSVNTLLTEYGLGSNN